MRRSLLFFCVLACGTGFCEAADPATSSGKTTAEMRGLHGPVRSMHTEMVLTRPGATNPFTQEDLSFDRDGWLTESISYIEGKESIHAIYRRQGPVVLYRETTYLGPRNPEPRKEVQTNNAQGRPTELLIYALDGTLKERTVRQYETGGIRELTYDGQGKLLDETFRTEKLERANNVEITETSANGKLESRESKQVTEGGSHTEDVYYSSAGAVTHRQIVDEEHGVQRGALVRSDGNRMAWTKDTAGNDLQSREEPNGNRIVTTTGSNGRKVEYYNRDGKLTSTVTTNDSEDERDEHGNWTRKTQYIASPGSEPRVNSITTRTISYY